MPCIGIGIGMQYKRRYSGGSEPPVPPTPTGSVFSRLLLESSSGTFNLEVHGSEISSPEFEQSFLLMGA